jgi:hypothetical protein
VLSALGAKAFWYAMATRCRFRLAKEYEGHHCVAGSMGQVSGAVELRVERV